VSNDDPRSEPITPAHQIEKTIVEVDHPATQAEAVRNPRIRDLSRRNVDDPRAAVAAVLPAIDGFDPDALARILIAIYQGLVLQTAWDENLDNEAFVRTVESLLTVVLAGAGSDGGTSHGPRSRPSSTTSG
jgi:hypothetical protein